jgi:hypothetical protein
MPLRSKLANTTGSPKTALLLFLGPVLGMLACATNQQISVRCVTQTVEVFVDGQLIEGNPDLLELSVDEPHKVFIRAEGYEPQLYTFEPEVAEDGSLHLTPSNVCIELVPVGQGRRLEVEIEEALP